ncbi:MAG TPA: rhomboid family intramembrane serine protease [Candidatus Limnocylindria bacterium]|nr:rhomboid family intramembrane serine protease [Candidatus Limnocylindria bacterium]
MFPLADENEPGYGLAWVNLALIAINVAVFLLLQQAGANDSFTYGFSAVPFEISHGVDLVGAQGGIPQAPGPDPIYFTLISSMFMHGGWLHIGGNMLFLWIFGDNVEHRIGHLTYLVFYLVAGVIAAFAQILVSADSVIPSLGASGAISGVLGAYLVMFPGNRVTVFVFRFLTQVPAVAAIGIWALLQFVNGLGSVAVSQETGGVAYMAHIGGFVAGLVAGFLFRGMFPGRPARREPMRSLWS